MPDMFLDRLRLFGLVFLLCARVTLTGADPARLELLGSMGGLILNSMIVLFWCVCLIWDRQFSSGTWNQRLYCIAWLLLAGLTLLSSQVQECYTRPSFFLASELLALAALAHLIIQQSRNFCMNQALLKVLLACGLMQAGSGVFQKFNGVPEPLLESASPVGKIEFYPQLEVSPFKLLGSKSPTPFPNNEPANLPPKNEPPIDRPSSKEKDGTTVDNEPANAFSQVRGTLPSSAGLLLVSGITLVPIVILLVNSFPNQKKKYLLIGLAFLSFFGGGIAFMELPLKSPDLQTIADCFQKTTFWGTGAGCWSRWHAQAPIFPNSYLFGTLATIGGLALIPFGLLCGTIWVAFRKPLHDSESTPLPIKPYGEVYLAAMMGLTWGLVWLTGELPVDIDTLWPLGVHAVVRASIWFMAYAILEQVALNARVVRSLLFGVIIVSVLGMIGSDSFFYPQIAWLGVAYCAILLGLPNQYGLTSPDTMPKLGKIPKILLLGFGLLLFGLQTIYVTRTGIGCIWYVREAQKGGLQLAQYNQKIEDALGEATRKEAQRRAAKYVGIALLTPLRNAAQIDQNNATLRRELIRWDRYQWQHIRLNDPEFALLISKEALELSRRCRYLDPNHPANPEVEFATLLVFLSGSVTDAENRVAAARRCIEEIVQKSPTREVELRFRLADALLVPSHRTYAINEIKKINQLLAVKDFPHGQLTPKQRETMQRKLEQVVKVK